MNWFQRLPYEGMLLIVSAFVIGLIFGSAVASGFAFGAFGGMLVIIHRAQRDRNYWREMR